ncbi:MAG: hypothetical protein PHP99_06220 [Paludibacter sp.]|nr:hypothetical protein [Paludibacter sp.]
MRKIILAFIILIFISCNKQNIKEYYSDGILKVEYTLISDKIEGRYRSFYPTGKIEYEAIFKNGQRNGLEKKYYENGHLKMKGVMKNDNAQGWYHYYNENQKLDSIIEYIMIELEHPFSSYMNSNIADSLKVSIPNRYFTYNRNGNIDKNNSFFFIENIKNDTIALGDTLWCSIKLIYLNKYKPKDFIISFSNINSDTIIRTEPVDSISSYFFFPYIKGNGLIVGSVRSKDNKCFSYFNMKYFVR